MALLDSYDLQVGISNSLEVKLNKVLQTLDQSNTIAARNILNAFTNEVQAQTGKNLSVDQATQLMDKQAVKLALSQ